MSSVFTPPIPEPDKTKEIFAPVPEPPEILGKEIYPFPEFSINKLVIPPSELIPLTNTLAVLPSNDNLPVLSMSSLSPTL